MESIKPPHLDERRTLTIGEKQGYRGLHVHFGTVFDHAYERETPQLTTAYLPDADELKRLNDGQPIIISLINVTRHPPIMVSVLEPNDD